MTIEEFDLALPPLALQGGGVLTNHRTRGTSEGPRDAPVVLAVHALTGSARVGGEGGWWGPLVGPGRAIDTRRTRVLAFNNLGSCAGATTPDDDGWPAGTRLTAVDQARALLQALDRLGVERLHLVAGGSLGGGVAYALAALAPHRVERLWILASTPTSTPWIKAFNHVQRAVIAATARTDDPGRGLELARQLAMLTYRAPAGLATAQDERLGRRDARYPTRVAGWLERHGTLLRGRFTTSSYLAQLDAMDSVDVDVDAIVASTLLTAIDTDLLYPAVDVLAPAARLALRAHVEVSTLTSVHGHDAFLIEWAQLADLARRALAQPPPRRAPSLDRPVVAAPGVQP
jgi:homoserine O-acetyltransferase